MADARDRIRPAVEHAGLEWPLRRVVVNLAPGNLRKEGAGLDLPIAASVLVATGQVPGAAVAGAVFFGELSLKGEVLPTPGVLSVAIAAVQSGSPVVVVPKANAVEAAHVEGIQRGRRVVARTGGDVPAWHLARARDRGRGGRGVAVAGDRSRRRARASARRAGRSRWPPPAGTTSCSSARPAPARRCSPAGCASILPELTRDEALEATQLHSVAGLLAGRGLLRQRPFRSPHHSISTVGLLGGGSSVLRPGEASLAHRGVLFLDELTEFRRDAIEALRQPLEDGCVVVTRASGSVTFPARFTLVAAANPCPCGFRDDPVRVCACRDDQRARYMGKLSGPLLDRIDLRVRVPRLTKHELLGAAGGEPSAVVRARVLDARDRQLHRYRDTVWTCNAHLPGPLARRQASLTDAGGAPAG